MPTFTRREYIGDIRLNSVENAGVANETSSGNFCHCGTLQYAFVNVEDVSVPVITNYYFQKDFVSYSNPGNGEGVDSDKQPPVIHPSKVPCMVNFTDDNNADNVMVNNTYIYDGVKPSGSLLVNAGNPALFPWLSTIARSYEQYSIEGLVLEYVPLISSGNTNTALVGSVFIGYQPNCTDDDFQTKASFLEHSNSISAKSNTGFRYTVPVNGSRREFFVNNKTNILEYYQPFSKSVTVGADTTTTFRNANPQDPKTLFNGSISIATQGFVGGQPGQQLGQLFVSYKVRLSKEKMPDGTISLY